MPQLALYDPALPETPAEGARPQAPAATPRRQTPRAPLCATCRAREARYGFHPPADDPTVDRPQTLCFECFRLELTRRQEAARAVQPELPLHQTLAALDRRRRRAQIAARRALGER